jgi:hypothetical protein
MTLGEQAGDGALSDVDSQFPPPCERPSSKDCVTP